MQKQPSKEFFKKGVMRNFAEFTRKHCAGIFFFNQVFEIVYKKTGEWYFE